MDLAMTIIQIRNTNFNEILVETPVAMECHVKHGNEK
jgi:hypothetical protein